MQEVSGASGWSKVHMGELLLLWCISSSQFTNCKAGNPLSFTVFNESTFEFCIERVCFNLFIARCQDLFLFQVWRSLVAGVFRVLMECGWCGFFLSSERMQFQKIASLFFQICNEFCFLVHLNNYLVLKHISLLISEKKEFLPVSVA